MRGGTVTRSLDIIIFGRDFPLRVERDARRRGKVGNSLFSSGQSEFDFEREYAHNIDGQ